MPKYMLAVHMAPDAEVTMTDAEMQQAFQDVDALNQAIQADGAWVFAGGLHPADVATVVQVGADGEVVTTDGPFGESKEHLGGFWVIECADLDAALTWARRATVACKGAVEVRPFQDDV